MVWQRFLVGVVIVVLGFDQNGTDHPAAHGPRCRLCRGHSCANGTKSTGVPRGQWSRLSSASGGEGVLPDAAFKCDVTGLGLTYDRTPPPLPPSDPMGPPVSLLTRAFCDLFLASARNVRREIFVGTRDLGHLQGERGCSAAEGSMGCGRSW